MCQSIPKTPSAFRLPEFPYAFAKLRKTVRAPRPRMCHRRHLRARNRFRGVRIFDVSDISNPKQVAVVQTCRGSHTHTRLTDPKDKDNVYVYISGSANVRPSEELAGFSGGDPSVDSNTALYTIVIIKVPVAHPEQANCVAHNGSLIPVPGRDIEVQGWYQGGILSQPLTRAHKDRRGREMLDLVHSSLRNCYLSAGRFERRRSSRLWLNPATFVSVVDPPPAFQRGRGRCSRPLRPPSRAPSRRPTVERRP
jgi:hypothetical protein